MSKALRLLLVEDSCDDEELVLRAIRGHGYLPTCSRVQDGASMREALASERWDLIVSDWSMPRFSASAALAIFKESALDVPFIIVSGTIGEESAILAMREGADDFILKSNLSRVGPAIERELRECEGRRARRKADDEVRRLEARYRALFESSPLPMLVFDVETLAFIAVNEAAVGHYGYRREEFAEMTIDDIQMPDDGAATSTNVFDGQTLRHRKKDGSIIQVELNSHDVEFAGRPARLVVASDVTARLLAQEALRKSEEQLLHAQKMDAVGRLAGGVAHDFNNLLSVILSYSALLLENLPNGDPVRDDLLEIEAAGKRAADLTRQLLAFSRQQVFHSCILDLDDVLAGMDKMLRRIVGEDIAFAALPTTALDKVRADRGQLEQIVMNLVVNARDAMPTGGKITIETANVELDEAYAREHLGARPGPHVMMAVSDTGVGMDAATQARIFEPFFTTKPVGKGTGLGLSTVFGLVRQYGGSVWVYSELGAGTTFKVYLPRCEAPADAPRASLRSPRPEARGSETILLVEDEEKVRAVAREILRQCGYHVLEARDADEAVRLCGRDETTVDLLLTPASLSTKVREVLDA